jgi:hypothetical protein
LAALFRVWPICGQTALGALLFEVGRRECNASWSSNPYGPLATLLLKLIPGSEHRARGSSNSNACHSYLVC